MANKLLKTLTLPNAQGELVKYELAPKWENIEGKPESTGITAITIEEVPIETTSMISFSIENMPYQAENDMTFGAWANTKYNTLGWYFADSSLLENRKGQSVMSPGGDTPVTKETLIQSENYLLDGMSLYFSFNDVRYRMDAGMTWGAWERSAYNTDGIELCVSNGFIYDDDVQSYALVNEYGDQIRYADIIEENGVYHWRMP